MNNYIIIGSYQYKTVADAWEPEVVTPRTIRVLQDGTLDATFASITIYQWTGKVIAPVTSTGSWGDIDDLEASLAYKGSVTYQDHYGTSYSPAYIAKSGPLKSQAPMWDGAGNEVTYEVVIMAEGT